jgi:hypothetical protein
MGGIGEIGSFLVDPLGIGFGDKLHGIKDKKKKDPVAQETKAQEVAAASPEGPTADVNKDILDKQNRSRRSFLLNRSTGRSPQGPQIEPIQQNRSLF